MTSHKGLSMYFREFVGADACTLFIAFEGPVDTTLGAAPALRSPTD